MKLRFFAFSFFSAAQGGETEMQFKSSFGKSFRFFAQRVKRFPILNYADRSGGVFRWCERVSRLLKFLRRVKFKLFPSSGGEFMLKTFQLLLSACWQERHRERRGVKFIHFLGYFGGARYHYELRRVMNIGMALVQGKPVVGGVRLRRHVRLDLYHDAWKARCKHLNLSHEQPFKAV